MVTFTNICSTCEPLQVVRMLNSMYLRFDRLTDVHGVYKVGRQTRSGVNESFRGEADLNHVIWDGAFPPPR